MRRIKKLFLNICSLQWLQNKMESITKIFEPLSVNLGGICFK